MHTIKIEIKEGNALVFTPYNGKFVSMVRAIGKWSGDAWEVPVSKLDDVKKCLVLPRVMMQPGQTILFI